MNSPYNLSQLVLDAFQFAFTVKPSSLMVNLMSLIDYLCLCECACVQACTQACVCVCVCARTRSLTQVRMFLCAALRRRGCLNELLAQLFLEPSLEFRYSRGMLSLFSCPRFLSLSYSLRLVFYALLHLWRSLRLPSPSVTLARVFIYFFVFCPPLSVVSSNFASPLLLFLPTAFSALRRSTHRQKYDPPPPSAFFSLRGCSHSQHHHPVNVRTVVGVVGDSIVFISRFSL